ncbi:hypothetical protein GCM10022243_50520 [Saccharothrix violaceirubra]|uniref:Uncharacterized protein n=1 Tax=Saccharothrix violaceirubra TaxID=413306 RepID=A0A7W7SZ33_9PSEU|nr:hypothetical protein [Saccharothrix violaceirubra]MBB4963606.1 hypothetical protein [Saccharothrix violaceirubra]
MEIDFDTLLHEVASESAPRKFAIVEEWVDGDVVVSAYGLAYADRAEAASVSSEFAAHADTAEGVRALFAVDGQAYLVWLDEEISAPAAGR